MIETDSGRKLFEDEIEGDKGWSETPSSARASRGTALARELRAVPTDHGGGTSGDGPRHARQPGTGNE